MSIVHVSFKVSYSKNTGLGSWVYLLMDKDSKIIAECCSGTKCLAHLAELELVADAVEESKRLGFSGIVFNCENSHFKSSFHCKKKSWKEIENGDFETMALWNKAMKNKDMISFSKKGELRKVKHLLSMKAGSVSEFQEQTRKVFSRFFHKKGVAT
jgi:ribonuclease HI